MTDPMREHDYFGALSPAPELWNETLDVGEQRVDVALVTDFDAPVVAEVLDVAAALVHAVEGLDVRGRNAIVSALNDRAGEASLFLTTVTDELGPDVEDVLVDISGDTEMDLIRSLLWERLVIHVNRAEEAAEFATLVYGVDSEAIDQRIAVTMAPNLTVLDVRIIDSIQDSGLSTD